MKKKLLFITALLCILSQSTWAQGVKTEDELVNAVKENGAIVQLAADITLNNTITLQENIKVTIKMNSHTLSHKKQLDSNYNCVFIIPASSELVLESGTIDNVNNVNTRNTEYVAGAIVNNGTLTLNTVTVSNCSGLQGGAIKNNQGATLNLNSCTFDTNEAATNDNNGGDGGAVWNSGKLVLYNTSFKDCSAVNGAAIYNEASGTISMGDNNSTTSFYSNKASGDGGAIYNLGTMNMNSTTFSTNIASDQAGAVWNIGILTFKGCDFLYNKANTAAGLYVAPNGKGNVTINGGSFKQNVANIDGGGIYCEYTMNLDAVTTRPRVATVVPSISPPSVMLPSLMKTVSATTSTTTVLLPTAVVSTPSASSPSRALPQRTTVPTSAVSSTSMLTATSSSIRTAPSPRTRLLRWAAASTMLVP